ncbi:hypothetical protein H0H93_000204 [Arthromyces matolae]|nr:hypothetical protein H0H93_000204 [Arthromyces matolae]
MSRTSRLPLAGIVVVSLCIFLFFLYNFTKTPELYRHDSGLGLKFVNPQRRKRVAVASSFTFHHDVYMTVAWSVAQAMNRSSVGSVEVYAQVPFAFDFQQVVDDLGLYRNGYRPTADLIPALRDDVGENSIDLVVLGTCEIDLRIDWTKDLLSIWDERPQDRKFNLDTEWQPAITEWSRRGAIRLITISEHVAHSFRESFNVLADSPDPTIRSAGYENIPIDVHVPILPLHGLPEHPAREPLSRAVIQGSFNMDRRDYAHIFRDLIESLHGSYDPAAWGYKPLGEHASFIPDTDLPTPAFQLFALGSGNLDVPIELQNLVQVKTGLTYQEFYDIMKDMDICVPAFAEAGYYHNQASSTFAMAVQCNVPILVTRRTRDSYAYADDDRAVVTRPAAMREIQALKALRIGDSSFFLNSPMPNMNTHMGSNQNLNDAVESMMNRGWRRTKREMDDFKVGIWKRNDDLAYRLIHD